jgi:hypothetical protein
MSPRDSSASGLAPLAVMVAPSATWMLSKLNTATQGLKASAWAA